MSYMTENAKVGSMVILAAAAHKDQVCKNNHPYILHCIGVMENVVRKYGRNDYDLLVIALGHDLLEDTKVTEKDLLDLGFERRVVEAINCLTKVRGQSYKEYKEKVKSNFDAVRVKMCDILHNTDPSRVYGTEAEIASRRKYYMDFYKELEEAEKTFTMKATEVSTLKDE